MREERRRRRREENFLKKRGKKREKERGDVLVEGEREWGGLVLRPCRQREAVIERGESERE